MSRVILALGLMLCALAIVGVSVSTARAPLDLAPQQSQAIDCSLITSMGLDRQANPYAAEARRLCGFDQGSAPSAPATNLASAFKSGSMRPQDYGGPDVDTITGI